MCGLNMGALNFLIFVCSVTFCLAAEYSVLQLGWYEGGCGGGCNTFFGPVHGKAEAIRGYCPKGATCVKRSNFYLTMKRCCDDVSFNMKNDDIRVDYYNSVVVMYGYYTLDYFKPKDLWNKKDAEIDGNVKASVIPLYPKKGDSPLLATVLYAFADGTKCTKRTYALLNYVEDDIWFDYTTYYLKKKFEKEEAIPCSEFEKAKEENDCLDCFEYTATKTVPLS